MGPSRRSRARTRASTQIQAPHAVLDLPQRGEKEDRDRAALLAQLAADFTAIEAGEQDVQNDEVVRNSLPQGEGILAIGHQIDRVMAVLQSFFQVRSQLRMVFHH